MTGFVKLMRLEDKMTIQRQQGGSQRDWDEVRQHSDLPIITIITSTYNVVQDLHWTIDSIREQTYPNLQWIIADGASTDGTVEMLEANSGLIDYWFSEPDMGIYDAWNKALEHVKGDWVQFIGAGDELYETNTLEKVASHLKDAYPNYELVYGQVVHLLEKNREVLYVSGEPWKNYQKKWEGLRPKLPVQTGIFHHIDLFKDERFNTNYKIIADCVFLLKTNIENYFFIPLKITKMPAGGISGNISSSTVIYDETKKYLKEADFSPSTLQKINTQSRVLLKVFLIKSFGENMTKIIFSIYHNLKHVQSNDK